jgi:hypothetical protein
MAAKQKTRVVVFNVLDGLDKQCLYTAQFRTSWRFSQPKPRIAKVTHPTNAYLP